MYCNIARAVAAPLFAGFLFALPANAATLQVPADFPTIQLCINAAISGQDECVVAPGTYNERINFFGKAVTLRSSHGPEITTIDGAGLLGFVLTCKNNESPNTIIDGFTIRNGGMENNPGHPTVMNCVFTGGGIVNSHSDPTITRCLFIRNTAAYGAAIYGYVSGLKISKCVFVGNNASLGGAIFIANEQQGGFQRDQIIQDCLFVGNTAQIGGAIFNRFGFPAIENCTLTDNIAADGGALYNVLDSEPTINGSILWGNMPNEIVNVDGSVTYLEFSNIEGAIFKGTVNLGGVIHLDPFFSRTPDPGPDGDWDGVGDDYGDLRLQAGSPCIDAADPQLPEAGETDLDGHARALCGRVDMGAYEFGIGDYDCNQIVNLADLGAWEECETGPVNPPSSPLIDGCEAFDFDGDGGVDLRDVAEFMLILTP